MIHALAGSLRVPVSALFEDDGLPKTSRRKASKA
jgi:hypothetical protein